VVVLALIICIIHRLIGVPHWSLAPFPWRGEQFKDDLRLLQTGWVVVLVGLNAVPVAWFADLKPAHWWLLKLIATWDLGILFFPFGSGEYGSVAKIALMQLGLVMMAGVAFGRITTTPVTLSLVVHGGLFVAIACSWILRSRFRLMPFDFDCVENASRVLTRTTREAI
jgi:hypothetical protein